MRSSDNAYLDNNIVALHRKT